MTSVSVIVPSIGSTGTVRGAERTFVVEAVRSVLATAGVDIEVIVVAGREMPAAVVDELAGARSAGHASVDYDDAVQLLGHRSTSAQRTPRASTCCCSTTTPRRSSPDWLTQMLDACASPGVGAVGAKLLFEDGTLQHAGHTYRTSLDHVGFGLPGDASDATACSGDGARSPA